MAEQTRTLLLSACIALFPAIPVDFTPGIFTEAKTYCAEAGILPAQDIPVLKETQLLNELQRLASVHRQWMVELKEEATRTHQSSSLPEYRTWHLEWQRRLQEQYSHLTRYYEMVSRAYRTNPKSPLYIRLRDTYLQAKTAFDQLHALHAGMALPDEKLPVIQDRRDGKLTRHLSPTMNQIAVNRHLTAQGTEREQSSETMSEPTSPTSEPTSAGTFLQSLQQSGHLSLEYIGTFDLLEVYLLRQSERSYYIMYGWRQPAIRDGESILEVAPHFIIAGPLSQIRTDNSSWHFEQIIQLPSFPLKLENPLLERVTEAMARSRTYTHRQP